jgi:hypothetical protein
MLQRLGIRVGADKFHAFNGGLHHVVNGIAATATNADDLDDGVLGMGIHQLEH